MKLKGALVDIAELRSFLELETQDEEFFRKFIREAFHRFNAAFESKYIRDMLVERGFSSQDVDNIDDYVREWLRQIEVSIPRDTTDPVCLDYEHIGMNTILVTISKEKEERSDPITETVRLLEGLVRNAIKDGDYVDPELRKFFRL